MTDPGELARALLAIADALDAVGATWAIGGSVASAAYGEPRSTNDVDLVATLSETGARAFAARLGSDFYADVDTMVEAVRSRGSFNVIDTRSFIKIDVFIPPPGRLGVGQLDRRVELSIMPGVRPLPLLGPEDVILQKLRWYQLGGEVSDRQWRDILSVMRTSGSRIDDAYLDSVASTEGLALLLERARDDAR